MKYQNHSDRERPLNSDLERLYILLIEGDRYVIVSNNHQWYRFVDKMRHQHGPDFDA